MDNNNVVVKTGLHNRLAMFLLGATLALGFALGAYMLSRALVAMRQENLIRVKGTAEVKIRSNFARWQVTVSFRAPQLEAAHAGLQTARTAVVDFLKAAKIADSELNLLPAEITLQNALDAKGVKTNAVEFYLLTQGIEVASSDVRKVQDVNTRVTELIKNGIELTSWAPVYVYTDLESIKLDLIGKATKNAYERAQALASNSNGQVGRLNAASQGVFQITPVNAVETSEGGVYDTRSIDKSVRCVVTLEFRVDK